MPQLPNTLFTDRTPQLETLPFRCVSQSVRLRRLRYGGVPPSFTNAIPTIRDWPT